VNRVGGSIKVSSEEGVGTIFTLNFFDMPDIL
jgi:chemotaxis protein histidine kinase CheA